MHNPRIAGGSVARLVRIALHAWKGEPRCAVLRLFYFILWGFSWRSAFRLLLFHHVPFRSLLLRIESLTNIYS
jgi:hypothetical protein